MLLPGQGTVVSTGHKLSIDCKITAKCWGFLGLSFSGLGSDLSSFPVNVKIYIDSAHVFHIITMQ